MPTIRDIKLIVSLTPLLVGCLAIGAFAGLSDDAIGWLTVVLTAVTGIVFWLLREWGDDRGS